MTETAQVTDAGTELDTKGSKVVKFDGVIENAYGIKLPSPLSYDAEYEELLSYDAIPAKEMPDNDDILTIVNGKRKANARQKAMQAALDKAGIEKPTLETSDDLRIKNIVDSLLASKKYTREVAVDMAKKMLGIE